LLGEDVELLLYVLVVADLLTLYDKFKQIYIAYHSNIEDILSDIIGTNLFSVFRLSRMQDP
jgi:hypothetical protein